MLDKDKKAVENVPKEEKDYRKYSMYMFYFAQLQHTKSRSTYS